MNRFDTITLELPRYAITEYNPQYFINQSFNPLTGEEYNLKTHQLSKQFKGFNSVKLTPEKCIIEFSAKVLQADYMQGINKDTYPNVYKYIDNSGVIRISESDFYYLSRFHKCHTADNIYLKNDKYSLNDYFTAMYMNTNPEYQIVEYSGSANSGLTFKKGKYTAKIYNKEFDMKRSGNSDMLDLYPELNNQIQHIARFETEHLKFKHIRERFGVDSLTWKAMLNSPVKVNSIIFDKMIHTEPVTAFIPHFSRIPDWRIYKAYTAVLAECDNDLRKVRKLLKSEFTDEVQKSNIRREYKAISEFKRQLLTKEYELKGMNLSDMIQEIRIKILAE
jgi:hypothetical protein